MNIFTHWLAVARMCPACLSAWVLCCPSPLLPSVSFLLSSITHSFDIHPSSLAQYFRSEWLCHLFSLNLIPQLSILFCLNSIDTRWFRVYRGTHFGKCQRCKTHTVPLLLDLWFDWVRSDAKCVVVRMTCRMPWRSVTAAATSPGLQRSDPEGTACTESEGHVGNSNAERTARQSS